MNMRPDFQKELPLEVRITLEGLRRYMRYSNLVTTYYCSAKPYYFVIFSAIGYEGYFVMRDGPQV